MRKPNMGQIMAECDCSHVACEMRGYCMAAHINALEAENERLREADLDAAVTAALREMEAVVRKHIYHDSAGTGFEEGAFDEAILALIDTPAAEALERVQTEERAKGMERAGVILLDHPHWTRWHVLEAIRAEAAAIRAQETDNA